MEPSTKKRQEEQKTSAVKQMLPPGSYLDPQLPETWTEKDLEKIKVPDRNK